MSRLKGLPSLHWSITCTSRLEVNVNDLRCNEEERIPQKDLFKFIAQKITKALLDRNV